MASCLLMRRNRYDDDDLGVVHMQERHPSESPSHVSSSSKAEIDITCQPPPPPVALDSAHPSWLSLSERLAPSPAPAKAPECRDTRKVVPMPLVPSESYFHTEVAVDIAQAPEAALRSSPLVPLVNPARFSRGLRGGSLLLRPSAVTTDVTDDEEAAAPTRTSQRPAPSSGGGHRRSRSAGLAARYFGSVGGVISLGNSSPTLNGRVGLVNLGNTCFMNAALQCLSHTSHFTRYFLQGDWQKDLNTQSIHGSGGALCREYAALTKQLWHSSKEPVAPVSFKNVLSHYAPQFEGYAQHDAQARIPA